MRQHHSILVMFVRAALTALMVISFHAPLAHAQGGELPSYAEAVAMLDADDPVAVRTGIETIGLLGEARGASAIDARVRRGLPRDLLLVAVETMGVLGHRSSGPTLVLLSQHRHPEVRQRALSALVSARIPGAYEALIRGLSDGEQPVREASARLLGQLGDHRAVEPLFHALDRRIADTAGALGALITEEELPRFLGYFGQVPFPEMAAGLTAIFTREDLSRRARLRTVAALQELATPDVKRFLEEIEMIVPGGPSDPVRRAIQDAILRISD